MVPPTSITGFFCVGATTGLCAITCTRQAKSRIAEIYILFFIVLESLELLNLLQVFPSGCCLLFCCVRRQSVLSSLHLVLHQNRRSRQPLFCLHEHILREDYLSRVPDQHPFRLLYSLFCHPGEALLQDLLL